MSRFLRALSLFFAVGICANAQRYEISPFYGYFKMSASGGLGSLQETAKDTDTRLKDGKGYGVRATWNIKSYWGFELGAAELKPIFETAVRPSGASADVIRSSRVNLRQGFFNGLAYMMPHGERFRPFLTAGMQLQQYGRPNIAEFGDNTGTRNYGINYGGGIKIRLFPHAQVRADFRHYMGGKPYDLTREDATRTGGRQHYFEGSIGFGITF